MHIQVDLLLDPKDIVAPDHLLVSQHDYLIVAEADEVLNLSTLKNTRAFSVDQCPGGCQKNLGATHPPYIGCIVAH